MHAHTGTPPSVVRFSIAACERDAYATVVAVSNNFTAAGFMKSSHSDRKNATLELHYNTGTGTRRRTGLADLIDRIRRGLSAQAGGSWFCAVQPTAGTTS